MVGVSSYPHMTKSGRNDFFKGLKKTLSIIADPNKSELKSYKEVAMNLARKMRGY